MTKNVLTIAMLLALFMTSCKDTPKQEQQETTEVTKTETSAPERPTDAEFRAFIVYHHMEYMKTTAAQAGGTNKLLHTKEMPTEGLDPVVTPALDHIYSKAVIDLTAGPVTVEFPKVEKGRYFSIMITDEEHYVIYDEMFPSGTYVFVRKGKNMKVPANAKVIECIGDYPHLFVRVQVYNKADLPNAYAIQDKIKMNGVSKTLEFDNPIQFVLDNSDVYPQNKAVLESEVNFSKEDYLRVSNYVGTVLAPKLAPNGNMGMFGPIDSDEKGSNDMETRAFGMIGHLGLPVNHAYYQPNFVNCNDEVLNGDKTEVFTFSYYPEGVEQFWSITRYSAITRNTLAGKNDLFNAYNTKPDKNGNITVTFSVEDPKDGTYWMPVNAGEPYYFVDRFYGPDVTNLPGRPCPSETK
jgi:hypothetical protein